MCLTVLICFKTLNIVLSASSPLKKEVLAAECDNDGEKKAEKTTSEKEKESAIIDCPNFYNNDATDRVVHGSIYSNHYQSAHFYNISIPPPDTFTL